MLRHVYIFNSQEPHCYSPNCLRLVWGQNRAVTLPNLYVNMFKDHLVAEALSRNPQIFVHCVRRGQWTTSEAERDKCMLSNSV